jgi:hypothetical protein
MLKLLESGAIIEDSDDGPSVRHMLSTEEFQYVDAAVGDQYLHVDLSRDRDELQNAFNRWLDRAKPPSRRASREDRHANTSRWVDLAVVPYVDLDQWSRWAEVSLKKSDRAKILAPFHYKGSGHDAGHDAKALRTVESNAATWLTSETLERLLAATGESTQTVKALMLSSVLKGWHHQLLSMRAAAAESEHQQDPTVDRNTSSP